MLLRIEILVASKVYFDTQSKRPKIVSVKSSNSGYHPKWVYIGVAGSSLRKLLDRGVSVEMDKAMMMLVKKSKAGAVDAPRVDENTSSKTISIELLDENGNKVVGGSERVPCEGVETPSRKRARTVAVEIPDDTEKEAREDAAGSGVNRILTIIGNRRIIQPTVDPEVNKEVIRVEIRPTER
ncbi:hypothetical protein AgCh_004223 [Apium graveolens]